MIRIRVGVSTDQLSGSCVNTVELETLWEMTVGRQGQWQAEAGW